MYVLKFGGTSIKDAAAIERVLEIVSARQGKKTLVVFSALAGVTDMLIEMVEKSIAEGRGQYELLLDKLEARHLELAGQLLANSKWYPDFSAYLHQEMANLRILLSATETIRVESRRISNALLSIGELLSTKLIWAFFQHRGLDCLRCDARQVIIMKYDRDEVVPLKKEIVRNGKRLIEKSFQNQDLIITQGFIASTLDGAPATLGRDGSDLTAALLGAALKAEEIQIWSDVDGILSADPSIEEQARPIPSLTFSEASELAYFGARVLHPATIQPAIEGGIAVRVLNSSRINHPGTLIVAQSENGNGALVKSIAYKEAITLLTIESSHLLLSPGRMEEIFRILNRHGKKVYAVSKSATKISFTIQNYNPQDGLEKDFATFGKVEIQRSKAVVSVVGEQMQNSGDLPWRIIRRLEEHKIHLDLISLFANHISFMFIVDEKDIGRTVNLLHQMLIIDQQPS